ncbi:GIY-YIG nuclease family protein [Pseudomonas sp. MAG002Y]|uniref:GIY-YIG nuclease family protein n=1 Tax=Pseudomonas sp. MAG002Y TaxID=2678690 RepID=UPI001C60B9D0|nr:GIY-YIG nuclease family protein [Pseudomonas sp. MAG002Y]MBW5416089.1 hypothetical protein [Pseudomonas sp. MAG002Y]
MHGLQSGESSPSAYVYFLRHDTNNSIKIGKTIDLPRRWRQLGGSFDLTRSFYKVCSSESEALALERRLHRAFKRYQFYWDEPFEGCTEWFDASVMDVVIELVDGVLPIVVTVTQVGRPKPKKAKPAEWRIRPGLYMHWQYEVRLLLKDALRVCTLELAGDKLLLTGEEAERYSYLLFRHCVEYETGHEYGWFKVFGSLSVPRPPDLQYSLTLNSSVPLSTFAGLVVLPGEQFQTSFSYV